MILEAMIALLVFSLGILGIVGLQAASIKASSDAKYRSEAALLANEVIGRMWVSDRTQATLQAGFASPDGAAYQAWAWVGNGAADAGTQAEPTRGSVLEALPGAADNLPTIAVAAVAPAAATVPPTPATSLVTVTVFWQLPGEPTPHNYTAVAQIGG
ncbi:MAG: hypothetical protein H6R17_3344 [Proteobacteria bacterium]|nr:hypothetical protein [Pseudomonadota bacterium]